MRVCVAHVYWMLLFISALSSGLLFLIVASENIQANKFISPDRNQGLAQDDNVSIVKNIQDQYDTDGQDIPNHKISSPIKSKLRDPSFQDFTTPLSASFENANKHEDSKIPEEMEILKESLSQQPNLSQGISDGGQPIVLTLVDTAATLQSLASGRTEFRPKSEGNVSSEPVEDEQHADNNLVRLAELLESNATSASDDGDVQVVVVRAEQKRSSSIREEMMSLEGKIHEAPATESIEPDQQQQQQQQQQQELPKSPTTAPELNDSAARAQLTGSADDSAAAAILDSLVTAGPSEPHEDMPSFNEWAQKRLVEEAEKKKTHPNASVQTANGAPSRGLGGMRMRSKNYASPDCGAKVVAATPESSNVRNILVSSRDEYMLNACTNRVWFVVELCEAIQARKIELANFELFSSSPKDLSVFVSDRFPTRDWTFVGQFTARDERDVQSFVVEPRLFGKFIKVELQSHYGSEHFCPISLFRAYGTSEFEVLETETESDAHTDGRRTELVTGAIASTDSSAESEDVEDVAYVDEEQPESVSSNPLFAVLRLIRKGAEMLIRSTDYRPAVNNITKIQESISGDVLRDASLDDCGTPQHNIACRGCDDERFGRVFQLISCKRHYLESLISSPFIRETLARSRLCENDFGSDLIHLREACTDVTTKALGVDDAPKYYFRARFLSSLFTPDYIIALCNVLAAREQRLFANTSYQEPPPSDHAPNKTLAEQAGPVPIGSSGSSKSERESSPSTATDVPATSSETAKPVDSSSVLKSKVDQPTESINLSESLVTQIKPTKTTATLDDAKMQSFVPSLESSKNQQPEDSSAHKLETPATTESSVPVVTKRPSALKAPEDTQESVSSQQREVSSASASSSSSSSPSSSSASSSSSSTTTTTTTASTTATSSKVTPSSADSSAKSSSEKIDTGSKVETKGADEPEIKQKVEPDKAKDKVGQDPATSTSQEQLNFEGFDLKDLDIESNGNNKNDASAAQQSIASTVTPQQKESVFQRLSNRIKTLERNMSLSSQYLEELSRRYKKQVEEMQRSLERAMTTMNEESRKGEERENKRLEEVAALRGQISGLSQLLDDLVSERNSWWRIFSFSALAQHGLFVLVDVVLVVLILSYCRRADDDDDETEYVDEKEESGTIQRTNRQAKTYEIVKQKCNQLTKKPKKRRPSEIASQVSTGSYDQLMIENMTNASKNNKKKKRKKEMAISRTASIKETTGSTSRMDLNVQMHSRSASASDALCFIENRRRDSNGLANLESQRQGRPDSAPDTVVKYFSNDPQSQQQQSLVDRRVQILAMDEGDDDSIRSAAESRSPEDLNVSSALEDDAFEPEPSIYSSLRKKLSSPSFMKTALGTRNKRISFSGSSGKKVSQSLDESSTAKPMERRFDEKIDSLSELGTAADEAARTTNGFMDESDESRSSCATPTNKKKRASGLKKMVRKFF